MQNENRGHQNASDDLFVTSQRCSIFGENADSLFNEKSKICNSSVCTAHQKWSELLRSVRVGRLVYILKWKENVPKTLLIQNLRIDLERALYSIIIYKLTARWRCLFNFLTFSLYCKVAPSICFPGVNNVSLNVFICLHCSLKLLERRVLLPFTLTVFRQIRKIPEVIFSPHHSNLLHRLQEKKPFHSNLINTSEWTKMSVENYKLSENLACPQAQHFLNILIRP